MKTVAIIVAVGLLSACAWQSKALKVGDDTYQVSANASPARGGVTGARGMALSNANKGARPGHPTNYCLISLDNHVPVHVGSRSLSSWATLARTLSRCKTRRTTIALPGVFAAPGCGAWMSTQARTIRTASNG